MRKRAYIPSSEQIIAAGKKMRKRDTQRGAKTAEAQVEVRNEQLARLGMEIDYLREQLKKREERDGRFE